MRKMQQSLKGQNSRNQSWCYKNNGIIKHSKMYINCESWNEGKHIWKELKDAFIK